MPNSTNHLQQHPTRHLRDVAAVRLGFTPVREKRWTDAHAGNSGADEATFADLSRNTVLVVQPTHITDDGAIDWRRLDRVNVPQHQSFEGHILWPGTVLLCLRGVMRVANLTAQTLEQDLDATGERLPVVASGAWAVIRPDTNALSADYLCWHLKQPSTASRLSAKRTGSALQFIPLSAVQEIELPVPQLSTQAAIARVSTLLDRLGRLEAERLDLLQKYVAGSLHSKTDGSHTARGGKPNARARHTP
jgi:hypothetical protein